MAGDICIPKNHRQLIMKKIAVMMLVPNLHFSEMRDVGKKS
jgi:hypothetical protein